MTRPPNLAGPQIVTTPPNLALLLTHCGQLIVRKTSKFDDTICQILRLNASNLISAGALPQTPLRELTRDPEMYLRGPTFKARAGLRE